MSPYELKRETPAFQAGYWDGFVRVVPSADNNCLQLPSERIDYQRGYRAGLGDSRR